LNCISDFYFVLVVENLELFVVLDNLALLLEFELQERIANHTNTDVDRLDVVFYSGDRLLDILKGRVV
jgi:hypothetical protein